MRIFGRGGQNGAAEQYVERADAVDILELAAARVHEVVAAAENAAGDIGDAAVARPRQPPGRPRHSEVFGAGT
jgi:hypothetical protein